jgi:ribonucleoside-diphosphate reductase alpha chain
VDYPALEEAAALAVRFLDDILEVNRFPLPQTARASRLTRKVGLGVMGFADLLSALGIPYASPRAAGLGREIMARIQAAARQASADLGRRRGSFPAFPASRHRRRGWAHMRNATVTTVAPTGTLSLLMGCSSGIEPHFAMAFTRRVLDGRELAEVNPLFLARLKSLGLAGAPNLEALAASGKASAVEGLPRRDAEIFASAREISPEAHLAVQAAFQEHTDNAVSKTVNLPAEAGVEAVRRVFLGAHRLGLKGVTVFRHGCRGPQVLELAPPPAPDRCPSCGASGRE